MSNIDRIARKLAAQAMKEGADGTGGTHCIVLVVTPNGSTDMDVACCSPTLPRTAIARLLLQAARRHPAASS